MSASLEQTRACAERWLAKEPNNPTWKALIKRCDEELSGKWIRKC